MHLCTGEYNCTSTCGVRMTDRFPDVDDTASGTDWRAMRGHQFLMQCLQHWKTLHTVNTWRTWRLNEAKKHHRAAKMEIISLWVHWHYEYWLMELQLWLDPPSWGCILITCRSQPATTETKSWVKYFHLSRTIKYLRKIPVSFSLVAFWVKTGILLLFFISFNGRSCSAERVKPTWRRLLGLVF